MSNRTTQNGKDPLNDEWQRDLGVAYGKAAKILSAQQSSEAALRLAGEGSTILEKLLSKDQSSPRKLSDVAVAHGLKVDIYLASARVKEALNSYRQELTLTEALMRLDPSSSEWRSALDLTQQKIGSEPFRLSAP
jgi:hypothetical protein